MKTCKCGKVYDSEDSVCPECRDMINSGVCPECGTTDCKNHQPFCSFYSLMNDDEVSE